jgi:hypothetical protein
MRMAAAENPESRLEVDRDFQVDGKLLRTKTHALI